MPDFLCVKAVKCTIRKNMRTLSLTLGLLLLTSSLSVQAGGINPEEARLIKEASGRFTYEGKTYRAKESYLELLREKLSEDDMDLSAAEVDSYLATMYASVAQGLEQGILEEVPEENGETESEASELAAAEKRDDGRDQKTAETQAFEEQSGTSQMGKTSGEQSASSQNTKETTSRQRSEADSENEEKQQASSESGDTETESEPVTVKEETKASLKVKGPESSSTESKTSGERGEQNQIPAGVLPTLAVVAAVILAGLAVFLLQRKKSAKGFGGPVEPMEDLTDLHCHILPGVDDGSRDLEMTLRMLELEYRQGIRRIIATPHDHAGYVQNDPETLRKALEEVREKSKELYPDLELRLGNEIFYSDGILERLQTGETLTLGEKGSRYVLVEFSPEDPYSRIQEAVTKLMRAGYRPVIAHVERYACMHKQKAHFEELQEQGVLFQVNYNSIEKNKWLFCQGFVDLLSTDCHNDRERRPEIRRNWKILNTYCSKEQIHAILRENPDRIWNSGNEKER